MDYLMTMLNCSLKMSKNVSYNFYKDSRNLKIQCQMNDLILFVEVIFSVRNFYDNIICCIYSYSFRHFEILSTK